MWAICWQGKKNAISGAFSTRLPLSANPVQPQKPVNHSEKKPVSHPRGGWDKGQKVTSDILWTIFLHRKVKKNASVNCFRQKMLTPFDAWTGCWPALWPKGGLQGEVRGRGKKNNWKWGQTMIMQRRLFVQPLTPPHEASRFARSQTKKQTSNWIVYLLYLVHVLWSSQPSSLCDSCEIDNHASAARVYPLQPWMGGTFFSKYFIF